MQANELRLGNLVKALVKLSNGKTFTAHEFFPVDYTVIANIAGVVQNAQVIFEPIPLTPEILEKAGAKWIGDYLAIDLIYCNMQLGFFNGSIYKMSLLINGKPNHFGSNYIDTVHRLQNFYFDFTKQELQINL